MSSAKERNGSELVYHNLNTNLNQAAGCHEVFAQGCKIQVANAESGARERKGNGDLRGTQQQRKLEREERKRGH